MNETKPYSAENILNLITQFVKDRGCLPLTSIRSQPIRNKFGQMTVGEIDDALENDLIENIDSVLLGVESPVLTTRDFILATGIGVLDDSSSRPRLKPADYLLEESGRKTGDVFAVGMSAERAYEEAWKAAVDKPVKTAPAPSAPESPPEKTDRSKIRKAYLQSSTGMSGSYSALRRAQWAIASHNAPGPKAE